MRNYDAATLAHLQAREGIVAVALVWITAKNNTTDLIETIGFWTGLDTVSIPVDGSNRTYIGAGALLDIDPVQTAPGLDVRTQRVSMSSISVEVEDLVKGYTTRFAPLEIHRALFDPETRALIGEPHRIFKGRINSIQFTSDVEGGTATCGIDAVSGTRILTRKLAGKKSAQTWEANGGDTIRKYGDISGNVPVYWGELRISAPSAPPPKPPAEVTINSFGVDFGVTR